MFIWCPNNGDECNQHIVPVPKSCFLIYSTREGHQDIVATIEAVCEINDVSFQVADRIEESKNMLCKICEILQGTSFGIVLYTKNTPHESLPNIFYESGLMHAQGKSVIFIGWEYSEEELPSDIADLEWILTDNILDLEDELDAKIGSILKKFRYFVILGQNEEEAKNYEKAVEYYTKAGLLAQNDSEKAEIVDNFESVLEGIEELDMLPILKSRIRTFKNFIRP